jgi:hypothetical protein
MERCTNSCAPTISSCSAPSRPCSSANLDCLIADQHISSLEGMIGAFPAACWCARPIASARGLLIEAGYGAELRDE